MKRIAIDMDEVIADAAAAHLEWYNRDYNDNLRLEDLEGTTILQLRPHRAQEIVSYYDREHFFRELKVIEHSQEVIRELSSCYEIYIATAAMEVPASFKAKYEWLLEHFSFLDEMNFVFCGNKSVIRADYLIDDNPKQLERFQGQGLLYTAPHNRFQSGYVRVNNWSEVRAYFMDQDRQNDAVPYGRTVK